MTAEIDLHIHTTASEDGELTPREVFKLARALGLRAIAFTDHDSVAAVDEGLSLSAQAGVDFAPAVEITTKTAQHDLHVIGYFLDRHSPELARTLDWIGSSRLDLARRRVERLRDLGFHVAFDDVLKAAGGRPPTTAAVLAALRSNPGNADHPGLSRYITGDRSDSPVYNFYRDWFCPGGPAYLEMQALDTAEAIGLVHRLAGVAVLAHPGRTPGELVERLIPAGLDGVEVWCSTHSAEDSARFERFAREHGLLMTAGSDFHGPGIKPDVKMGVLLRAEYSMFAALRDRASRRPGKIGTLTI